MANESVSLHSSVDSATLDGGEVKENIGHERLKHPLENTWCLWLNSNMSKNWDENQIEITSFDTVEDYWCLFHHLKTPSELKDGQDYSVFKKGINPKWEDPVNQAGCRLVMLFDKRNSAEMDAVWVDTVLLAIGENFGNYNHLITGVVVNIKSKLNKNKISIWLRDKRKQQENIQIGLKLKQTLGINSKLHFYPHNSRTVMYSV